MNEYGWVLINDEYEGIIKLIENHDTRGDYKTAKLYPTTDCEPTQYPELTWDYMMIECYELPEDEDVNSIVIQEIKLDGYFEFNVDLEFIRKYYDHHSLCMVVYAK